MSYSDGYDDGYRGVHMNSDEEEYIRGYEDGEAEKCNDEYEAEIEEDYQDDFQVGYAHYLRHIPRSELATQGELDGYEQAKEDYGD